MIPGVGLEAMFAKGLLDKLGVKADYIQIGEFEGADEQLTRTGPSEQLSGELNKLIDAMYAEMIESIAGHRKISDQKVRQFIDETMLNVRNAKAAGYVDHLVDVDGLRDLMAAELAEKSNPIHHYGKPEREEPVSFQIRWRSSRRCSAAPNPPVARRWRLFTPME